METKVKRDALANTNGFVRFINAIFGKKNKDESFSAERTEHKFMQQQKQAMDMAWIKSPWI